MRTRPKRVTLHDIAAVAGVSAQTVSRVVNNQEGVSDDTRQRIQAIMDELNYRPNIAARVLNSQKTFLLEAVLVDVGYMGEIGDTIAEMAKTAKDAGYDIIFSIITAAELETTLKQSAARMIDGFILLAPRLRHSDETMARLSQGIPFVRMSNQLGTSLPSVTYDFRLGTQLLMEYLVSLGHRQIAEISGPLEQLNALARHEEWQQFLLGHGLPLGPSIAVDYGMQPGYEAAHRLLEGGEAFTAVFAGNDDLALGVLRAFSEAGIRVPAEVSVIGFDDARHAAFVQPSLTTIRLDLVALGRIAAKYLIELIEDDAMIPHQRVLTPELIVRESTAPPRKQR
ncbi:MAG: LacI family DNA-binding transcriptional regulator [Anaerolineae bacterium]|nr:LacI family DNA-binding transcriptional regulator [Anaerolineae bacterium]